MAANGVSANGASDDGNAEPGPSDVRRRERAAMAPDESALPSTGARLLAFGAILLAGLCGGLIGWKVTDLQVAGDSALLPGIGGVVGAAIGAGGVGVVAVLVLRAMAEWNTIQATGDPAAARRASKSSGRS